MASPKYSVIVPVYNRPHELDQLLLSLTQQQFFDFDVLVVEDGSSVSSEKIVEKYAAQLRITYLFKPNSGPGPSRNFGFKNATGEYLVIFDSDCQVPTTYFTAVENFLHSYPIDAWGGPDRGNENFTPMQRAMAFTMSSILTTGGIRGGKSKNFQPRSFNMGMSREAYKKTNGFRFDRFAEDIELSIRMKKLGLRVALIPDALVYHQRRATWAEFFNQVSNFGRGRVQVGRAHAGEIKLTHWFPTFFLFGLILLLPLFFISKPLGLLVAGGYIFYLIAIAIDSYQTTKSIRVALLSVPSAMVQLTGYGWGFFKEKIHGRWHQR